MSRENVELCKRILEAFASGDFRTALEKVRFEVLTHRIAPLPDPKTYTGAAGVLMAWGELSEPFEGFELTVGELIDCEHSVVAEVRCRGQRTGGGGETVDEQLWFVLTFYEGELAQWDMLASRRQALRGVRMVEGSS